MAHLVWVRGTDASWARRFTVARQRWGRGVGAVTVAGAMLAVLAGGATYRQTNVRHAYSRC